MALPPGFIAVNVIDQGYFSKRVGLKPAMHLKKVMDKYRSTLCPECTNSALLEFWHEGTKLSDQTGKMLEIQDGDAIDVRVSEQCTRGSCPLPPQQTLPNIHYPAAQQHGANDEESDSDTIVAQDSEAPGRQRITFTMRNQNGVELTFCQKKTTPMRNAMKSYAEHVGVEHAKLNRFITTDGIPLSGTNDCTPESLEMEEDDQIHVHAEQIGGTGPSKYV
ncbi:Small ubiquitin- modifier 2 [Elasticomyces elasticus]|nr:Small ubiquitin- modifier 2 [Elasticomyces elasticus]